MTQPAPAPDGPVIIVGQIHLSLVFRVTKKLLRLTNRDFHRAETELLDRISRPEEGFSPHFLDWAGFPIPTTFKEPDPDARTVLRDQLRRANDVRARAGLPALRLGDDDVQDERLKLTCVRYNRIHKCTHMYPLLLAGGGATGFWTVRTSATGSRLDGTPQPVRVEARVHFGLTFANHHPLPTD